jgi:glycosyltransferase involved in cell wall biosynthesis
MLEKDWVVMPTIWRENSPVVIQESFFYGRPVIGSSIGGTAEKIETQGGVTFTARSENALAGVMHKAMGNASLHQALRLQIPRPMTALDCASLHLNLYQLLTQPHAVNECEHAVKGGIAR